MLERTWGWRGGLEDGIDRTSKVVYEDNEHPMTMPLDDLYRVAEDLGIDVSIYLLLGLIVL